MNEAEQQLLELLRNLYGNSIELEHGVEMFGHNHRIYLETLQAYRQLYDEHGFWPTVRDLSTMLGPESTAVQTRIVHLRDWGLLESMTLDSGNIAPRTTRPSELGRLLLSLADKLESES